jgi:HAD superfamily hydrolase (TIGR01549 family)
MTSLKLLSLDLFETLVHFKAHDFDSRSTLINALQKHPEVPEIPFDDLYSEYYHMVRTNMRNYEIEEEIRNDHILLNIWRNHNIQITPELEQTALNVIITYFDNVTNLIQPFSGVYETLENLKEKFTLVLLSNHSWAPNGEEVLSHFQLEDYFDKIIFSGKIGYKKPSSKIFDVILKSFPMKRENILHCGDDYVADVIGALKYGCKALWIENTRTHDSYFEVEDHPNFLGKISEIKDLPGFLETIE